MSSPETISPRGVPPIRTDWLADVARRLAAIGLPQLRALSQEQHGHLTDMVDGKPWVFELMKFSGVDGTVVEFDADLWAPADAGGRPSLRAGFALAPRWVEDPAGRATLVRTEIGPRAAVTFDPENWMVNIPAGIEIPVPAGVAAGEWSFDGGLPTVAVAADLTGEAAQQLRGLRVDLADLAPVLAGEAVPELVLGGYTVDSGRGGLLGRLRGKRAPAAAAVVLTVSADGPLDAAWTGAGAVEQALDGGLVLDGEAPVLAGEQLSLRATAGTLTLTGPALRADLVQG